MSNHVNGGAYRSIAEVVGCFAVPFIERYTEQHRKYHGMAHISHMLDTVDDMAAFYKLSEPERKTLHMATWLHDAVYDPKSSTNEEDSAALTDDPILIDLVMATKTHESPKTFLGAILIDADLAGLGLAWRSYHRNSILLKEELAPNDLAWYFGRIAWLKKFRARKTIYFTSYAEMLWGDTASDNLDHELESLLDIGI